MVLTGFYTKDSLQEKSKKAALEFAYQDVKKAFDYYIEHENEKLHFKETSSMGVLGLTIGLFESTGARRDSGGHGLLDAE